MEERLIKVETKLDSVVSDMGEVKTALRDIAASLSKLAVLEEKHNNVSEAMKRAFTQIDKNTWRLDEIEKSLPYLKLASGWVFKAMIGIMGLLGASALMTIMRVK